jgi:RNA 2',3'-cyclic 3'-phosphodiesterase
MTRLFTAVYLTQAAQASLDLALASVGGAVFDAGGASGPGLRWVPREQRHVTLAFHGNVPDGALEDYVAALAAELAEFSAFDAALAGAGTFGGRVLWAGLGVGNTQARALGDIVNQAALSVGFRDDDNAGGRPHLTLARASAHRGEWHGKRRNKRGGRSGNGAVGGGDDSGAAGAPGAVLSDWARALAVYQGPQWPVAEVAVMASQLGVGAHGGPLHTELARVPLA